MKIRILLLLLLPVLFFSCKEEEEPETHMTAPKVRTDSVTAVSTNQATVYCTILDDGTRIVRKGVCYSESPGPTIQDSVVENFDQGDDYSSILTGLKQNTIYFARAFAQNEAGTGYGEEIDFTTGTSLLPEVITTTITDITKESAVAGGNVINNGGQPVTERGICWSSGHFPTIEDEHLTAGTGIGAFTATISGLPKATGYFVRAYAINAAGTAYGSETSFMTMDSITGQPCEGLESFVYEGRTYHTLKVMNQCWTRENMNVGTKINGNTDQVPGNGHIEKYCYNDLESNCDLYGGLYQWEEAMQGVFVEGAQGICPLGWHIPTTNDWNQFHYGGIDNGTAMKYNTLWNEGGNGTNLSGFTGLPGGLRYYNGTFAKMGQFGYIWTSHSYDANNAWYRVLSYQNSVNYSDWDQKRLGFGVRCVKDTLP